MYDSYDGEYLSGHITCRPWLEDYEIVQMKGGKNTEYCVQIECLYHAYKNFNTV